MAGSLASSRRLLCEGWLDDGCQPGDGLVMYPTTGYVVQGKKVWVAFGQHRLAESSDQELVERYEELELEERKVGEQVLRLPKGGRWVVEGPFQRSDVENANRRKYPRGIWERLIADEGSYAQKAIRERAMLGHLEHPADGRTDGAKGAILVTKATLEKDGTVMGQAEILDTPMGLILQEYTRKSVRWGVSSRGNGSVKDDGTVDPENYVLETWDAVMKPSVPGAFPLPQGSKPIGASESIEEAGAGMHVVYLPANQAYQTMFGDAPTSIGDGKRTLFKDLEDLKYELRLVGLKLGKKQGKGYAIVSESLEENFPVKHALEFLRGKPAFKHVKWEKGAGDMSHVLVFRDEDESREAFMALKDKFGAKLNARRNGEAIDFYESVEEAEVDPTELKLRLAKIARRSGATQVVLLKNGQPLFYGTPAAAKEAWQGLPPAARDTRLSLVAYLKQLGAAEEDTETTEEGVLAEVSLGDTVVVKQPKGGVPNSVTSAFVGKRGRVIDMEKDGGTKMWRVRFDDPVQVPGVGEVEDDLFSSAYLRKLRESVLAEDTGDVTTYFNVTDFVRRIDPKGRQFLSPELSSAAEAHLREAVLDMHAKLSAIVREAFKKRAKADRKFSKGLQGAGFELSESDEHPSTTFEGLQGDAKEFGQAVSALVETDVDTLDEAARAGLHRRLLEAAKRGSALAESGDLSDQAFRTLLGWLTDKLAESMETDVAGLGDAIDEAIRDVQLDDAADRRDGFTRVTTSLKRRLEDALAEATSSRERLEAAESRCTVAEGQFRAAVEQLAKAETELADLGRRLSLAEGLLATRPTAEACQAVVSAVDEAIQTVPELKPYRALMQRAASAAEVTSLAESLLPRVVVPAPALPEAATPGPVAVRPTLPHGRVSSLDVTPSRVVESNTEPSRGAKVAAGALSLIERK